MIVTIVNSIHKPLIYMNYDSIQQIRIVYYHFLCIITEKNKCLPYKGEVFEWMKAKRHTD